MKITLQLFEIEPLTHFLYSLELEPVLSRKRSRLIKTLASALNDKTQDGTASDEKVAEILSEHCEIRIEEQDELYQALTSHTQPLSGDRAWAYDRIMSLLENQNHAEKITEEKPCMTN